MLAAICLLAFPASALAALPQDPAANGWKTPPAEVVEIVEAAPAPSVVPSPDGTWLLLVERDALPPLADVARPWVGLAGLRIDPSSNGRHRTSFSKALVLRGHASEPAVRVALPGEGPARIDQVSWSHSSRRFAFTLVTDYGIDLYVASADVGADPLVPTRVAGNLNAVFGSPFTWMPDGERLLVRQVAPERGGLPARPRVPRGPAVQETSGDVTPVRTYQDLLASPYDEDLFAYLAGARLALADPRSKSLQPLGAAGLITSFDPSPDGAHILVERLERPFSYVMPWRSFPTKVEVWDAAGALVHSAASKPAPENVPIGGVPTGPRSHDWKQSAAATLVWVEALDGGDPEREAEWRDAWSALPAPFAGSPRELVRTQQRAMGLSWLRSPSLVITREFDRDRRWTRSQLHDLDDPDGTPRVLDDRSIRDRYGSPGSFLQELDEHGARVLRQDGSWVYRSGPGDSPEGARPFLDRFDLGSGASERLWRCEAGTYETLAAIQASNAEQKPRVLTIHESRTSPPNWRLRDLQQESLVELTAFPDPTPQLRGVTKERVTYTRADGVPLSATLYLPAGYQEGMRLPLVVWAYPLEYNDPATAGQISGSTHRFTRVRGTSHLLFLTQGYAVLDGATMPIVGDPETMNDTFIEQIVASAQAAIDFAVERGVADRERVGVGGHSYGAFMTANLLAHSDLFAAGLARSGAYNRTLTPFGFQSERRTLWESPASYARISPFFHADKIDEPILMVHGEKDSNSGTFPIQSKRLYQAIKGNGGTARLVMLPHEDHGYRARESTLHVLAEMIEWFDSHVKGSDFEAIDARYEGERR